jgi:hypothetical protein
MVPMPSSMDELLSTLEPIYTGFDRIAPIATVVRSTAEGRALRLSARQRVEKYTEAAAEAVKDLPAEDARLATAMFQVLHTTPWLEMRDHWKLDGTQIARVTAWGDPGPFGISEDAWCKTYRRSTGIGTTAL